MRILIALLLAGLASAAGRLTVRFIEVEGGQATLIVAPSGESMLVDAGSGERDVARIQKALQAAGVSRLNYLLLTDFHLNHAGGVAPLARLVPVANFLDHGAPSEHFQGADEIAAAYNAAARGRRRGVYAGDSIALGAAEVSVLTANGDAIAESLPAGGDINTLCGSEKRTSFTRNENSQSVGILISFGKFRLLDLGSIQWNQELDFVCPVNRIGKIDVYVATDHGAATSGPATMVHALRPRVAVIPNGPENGAAAETFRILKSSPGLKAIWQLYPSKTATDLNSTDGYIANPEPGQPGADLVLSAAPTGDFSITNERTGKTESYPPTN